jgi:hypothetical protein
MARDGASAPSLERRDRREGGGETPERKRASRRRWRWKGRRICAVRPNAIREFLPIGGKQSALFVFQTAGSRSKKRQTVGDDNERIRGE